MPVNAPLPVGGFEKHGARGSLGMSPATPAHKLSTQPPTLSGQAEFDIRNNNRDANGIADVEQAQIALREAFDRPRL